MECDWYIFLTRFFVPVALGGVIAQVIIQSVGKWVDDHF